jgi:hypothetical protein
MKNLWETLKAIGINLPKLRNITLLKFGSLVHIDNSVKVEGSVVTIDPAGLSGKQRRALKHTLRTTLLDGAGAILDEASTPTVNAALEALPAVEEAAKRFIPIIPPEDVPLLRASLFLRTRYQAGIAVDEMKGQIVRVYGPRGRNFANLCTAGYLEDWFWPIYEELQRAYPDDPDLCKAKFRGLYNSIVNDLPWTEFVSAHVSKNVIAQEIAEKMKRNVELGVRYLNVHGLGEANVKKVMALLPEIQKQTGAQPAKIDKDAARIFVRLEIPVPARLLN